MVLHTLVFCGTEIHASFIETHQRIGLRIKDRTGSKKIGGS